MRAAGRRGRATSRHSESEFPRPAPLRAVVVAPGAQLPGIRELGDANLLLDAIIGWDTTPSNSRSSSSMSFAQGGATAARRSCEANGGAVERAAAHLAGCAPTRCGPALRLPRAAGAIRYGTCRPVRHPSRGCMLVTTLVHPQRDEAGGRVQFPVAEPGGRHMIWHLEP